MGRTYLRSANTQDVNDIEEKYANFASYTGINESKSFIDVDQNSFEEANNVYVNIDNELSTRPPVNSHSIDVIDSSYDMLDVFKVNGITFYKYARPFQVGDVNYSGTLSSSIELSENMTYELDDNFEWTDGENSHDKGTVLISYYVDGVLYYALGTYFGTIITIVTTIDTKITTTHMGLSGNIINLFLNGSDDLTFSSYVCDISGYSYNTYISNSNSNIYTLNVCTSESDSTLLHTYVGGLTNGVFSLYVYDGTILTVSDMPFLAMKTVVTTTTTTTNSDGTVTTETTTNTTVSHTPANYVMMYSTSDITFDSNNRIYLANYDYDVHTSDITTVYRLYVINSSTGATISTYDGYYTNYSEAIFQQFSPYAIRIESDSSTDTSYEASGEFITVNQSFLTGTNNTYAITWKYGNSIWNEDVCTESTKVFYIQDWYIFVDDKNNTIYAYKYDYDNSVWKKYELEDLIYVPTTSTVEGTSTTTDEGALNIFTTAYNEVYMLEEGILTDTSNLVGETVTVTVGDESFVLVWSESYTNVLSKSLGIVTYDVDTIISSTPTNNKPIYVGYCDYWLTVDGTAGCYYSITGDLWSQVIFPSAVDAGSFSATLSEQSSTLWIASLDSDNLDTITIYYSSLPLDGISSTYLAVSWYTITLSASDVPTYSYTEGNAYGSSSYTVTLTAYNSFTLSTSYLPLIHSVNDGQCVLFYWLDDFSLTYTRNSATYTINKQYPSSVLVVIDSYNAVPYITYSYDYQDGMQLKCYPGNDSCTPISLTMLNTSGALYTGYIICNDGVPTYNVYPNSNTICLFNVAINENTYVTSPTSQNTSRIMTTYNTYIYLLDGVLTQKVCYTYNSTDYFVTYVSNFSSQNPSTYAYSGQTNYLLTDTVESVTIMSNTTSNKFLIYPDTAVDICITDNYIYNNGSIYNYFEREGISNYLPVAIYTSSSSYYYVYWSPDNNTLYSTNYGNLTITRAVTSTNDNTFTEDDVNALSISFANELYTTTIATQNLLYQATAAPDGSGKLYFRTDSKVELPDVVTGMIYFSQTVLAIFVPYTAFEYTASSGDDGIVYYYLYPTKLVLGNREDYDILQSYDGSTIYICTERGMAGLTYETLVSSTEHIFSYLTDNIFTSYKDFDEQPILFCQYVRWIFMYRQDSNICYIYDMSGSSWWKWTLPYKITKMYADTDNDKLLLILNSGLYYFNFDADDFHDIETIRIDWSFKSQKLHLSAPNNYKHLRWLSVVTTQDTDTMRYKLKFTNYRHWHHMQDSSVVEYEINQLGTMRKKINFVKCNAFQFEISNDKTWKQPEKFVISNIAIKYRITEGIR